MILFFRAFAFQRKLIHDPLNTLMIYLKSTIEKFMVHSSDAISFFILIKDIRDFRRQIGISLFDRIGFADFVIVCRPGQSGCLQQLIQRVSFSSEFVDECSFFALSCAANFSCLKAIRFFITSFSVRKYSFSALSRISSSRSDGVSSAGTIFFFMSGSLGGRPFRCAASP